MSGCVDAWLSGHLDQEHVHSEVGVCVCMCESESESE